ncbi:hypothetical protein DC366_08955 [Pelagivirga sediminicola]|uniref:Uncharacterized protein n=1 Tax=Pelagivirga sediminicola TaxID=2170575 RepID=A0A2T7G7J6_9RHOB|nr:hypothetical protein [Pelagivirga sediminicola]PVA10357.1 hypothetical protein DC366_08955 [Pelagivirga sediminicola]
MAIISRLRAARHTALSAVATMIPALLAHELISFGVIHSTIRWSDAGCHYSDCAGIGVVLFGYALFAMPLAILFALAGAALAQSSLRRAVLAGLWLAVCITSLFPIASSYRGGFGTTWLWYEPFLELMLHPILTPVTVALGLWLFDLANRRLAGR